MDKNYTCSQQLLNDHIKDNSRPQYRLLELYSGIGGMRYALQAARIPFEVIAAMDINPVVNDIYKHNFGAHSHSQRNLLSFTSAEIENMKLDIITMSPPCQPFTRVGLKKDVEDARSSSFLHILDILAHLEKKPKYLLLENVQGFEDSNARQYLIQTLEKCGYRYQEFLLSPHDFGIPNSRLRYYLIAKLKNSKFSFKESQQLLRKMPVPLKDWKENCQQCCKNGRTDVEGCLLNHFLEEKSPKYFEPYVVPDHILSKYWSVFDIVSEDSSSSCCFTKAYSRYAQGTGSILCSFPKFEMKVIFEEVSKMIDLNEKLRLLKQLRLRYFTPKEIANVMCFPTNFEFPKHITTHQKYKSLGNSLNVFVVTSLMQLLLQDHGTS